MQTFDGRVAVITGGASGIGFGLAERAAKEGMTVVIADIEDGPLEAAASSLRERGATVRGHRVDVTSETEVEELAKAVFDEFGEVNLLCNNAGVMPHERPVWEYTIGDWQWVFGVNVWGVVHGVRSFVPRMLASGAEGHVVNTSSMAGLITGSAGSAVYDASKHAVLSLTESLYRDLVIRQKKVSASVLCPGAVPTNIFSAERNRPPELGANEGPVPESQGVSRVPGEPLPPEEIAEQVFSAVRDDRFYVLAAQTVLFEWTKMGHDRMWEGRNPAVSRALLAARDAAEAAG